LPRAVHYIYSASIAGSNGRAVGQGSDGVREGDGSEIGKGDKAASCRASLAGAHEFESEKISKKSLPKSTLRPAGIAQTMK
jgi:hypothetical protein